MSVRVILGLTVSERVEAPDCFSGLCAVLVAGSFNKAVANLIAFTSSCMERFTHARTNLLGVRGMTALLRGENLKRVGCAAARPRQLSGTLP